MISAHSKRLADTIDELRDIARETRDIAREATDSTLPTYGYFGWEDTEIVVHRVDGMKATFHSFRLSTSGIDGFIGPHEENWFVPWTSVLAIEWISGGE